MNLSRGAFAVLLGLSIIWPSSAQKSFDVASVKPNTSGREGGGMSPRGDRLVATNVTLRSLMVYAFGPLKGLLMRQQIIGGPQWIDSDHFDIEAKLAGVQSIPPDQIRLMLQSLLEERFQLKFHREMRELPVYHLVVTKRGPKMSSDQTPPDPRQSFITFDSGGEQSTVLPRGAIRESRTSSGTSLTGTGISVPLLVSLLQGQSDRIILDKSDIKGLLDIQLRFIDVRSPDQQSDTSVPSLFSAIEDVGLKLESAKAQLDVVVIDSVQKPIEN